MFRLKLHKPRIYSVTCSTVLLDNYFNFPENYCRNQRSNKIFTHKSISMQRAVYSNVVCVWAIKPANHCNLRYFSELSLFDDSSAFLKTHSDGFFLSVSCFYLLFHGVPFSFTEQWVFLRIVPDLIIIRMSIICNYKMGWNPFLFGCHIDATRW